MRKKGYSERSVFLSTLNKKKSSKIMQRRFFGNSE